MFGADPTVAKGFGRLSGKDQRLFAVLGEGDFDGVGDARGSYNSSFDFPANFHPDSRFGCEMPHHLTAFPHQSEKQMFGFDKVAAVLAGLVTREEDHPLGSQCV
jgi:hypothetical protein